MEGSISSINGSNACFGQQYQAQQGDGRNFLSIEELSNLLICTSMELESTRAAAKSQSQLQEARIRQLEELLKGTRRERDEARQECMQLQELLGRKCGMDSHFSNAISSAHPQSSGAISIIQESALAEAEISQEQMQQNGQFNFAQQQDQMGLQNSAHLGQRGDQGQNQNQNGMQMGMQMQVQMAPLQQQMGGVEDQNSEEESLSMPLSMQSGSVAGIENMIQPWQGPCSAGMVAMESSLSADSSLSPVSCFQIEQGHLFSSEICSPVIAQEASCSRVYSTPVIAHEIYANGSNSKCGPLSTAPMLMGPLDQTPSLLNYERSRHLPEPPEADMQVMLRSLPEKGKLLQAVMQAGPLLQTLLLAAPLPQWRHPPPSLHSLEIPHVSMPLPPSFHLPLHPKNNTPSSVFPSYLNSRPSRVPRLDGHLLPHEFRHFGNAPKYAKIH